MNAVRAAGYGDIGAVIHQDFCAVEVRHVEDCAGELGKFARAQVTLADLYQFHTLRDPVSDAVEAAVGDEAANHNAV
jgi:hypothetical protein